MQAESQEWIGKDNSYDCCGDKDYISYLHSSLCYYEHIEYIKKTLHSLYPSFPSYQTQEVLIEAEIIS